MDQRPGQQPEHAAEPKPVHADHRAEPSHGGHASQIAVLERGRMEIAAVAHPAGTCRFGTDPATSVLDVNCKAHELDNLYVVDTSFFPSIGAVNPGLTAIANALRVGDHLRQRLA